MSKKRKIELVDLTEWPAVNVLGETPFDWSLCVICQTFSAQVLTTPTLAGYESLASNLTVFNENKALPASVRIQQMNDGSGLQETLIKNSAKYHKACRCRFDNQKVNRLTTQCTAANRLDPSEQSTSFQRLTRSSSDCVDIKTVCIFCEKGYTEDGNDQLVSARTKKIGPNIHSIAVQLQDTRMLAKLSTTDMISLEAKYHKTCYTKFIDRSISMKRAERRETFNDPHRLTYGSVVSELVQFMEDMFRYNDTAPVFKLVDLTNLVTQRMIDLGVSSPVINRTRLKEQLLSFIPGLREDKPGRDVILSFDPDVGNAIIDACEYNDMSEGMTLARAASILRRDIFKDYPRFNGSLSEDFNIQNSTPTSLLNFISSLTCGSRIDNNSPLSLDQNSAAFSISQLIRFNSVKRCRANRPANTRHHIDRETPLPVYIGLMLHSVTRKKSLVDKLSNLGLSISYKRVQEIEATMTNTVCEKYNISGELIPDNLVKNVFTTSAIDNIDHNPTSTTSTDSFHGSSATIIQHPDTDIDRHNLNLVNPKWSRKVTERLPDSYTCLPPTGNVISDICVSTVNGMKISSESDTLENLRDWLSDVSSAVMAVNDVPPKVSFAAYHSVTNSGPSIKKCQSTLLPLLRDHINSPATVKHLMNVITRITASTNPTQVPVITADQPVYTIGKHLQWKFPETYGEDKIVLMMGGLHIEMAIQNMLGKWLLGSGWSDVFTQAEIATSGRAESLLKSSHVKRTRYAHEVSIASLYILRQDSYRNNINQCATEPFEEWVKKRCTESAQFLYWNTTLELESILLNFVRSIRESNFPKYIDILQQICPWLFALDLVNYARWLPVFVKTLQELPERHPVIFEEFMKGHFTNKKSLNNFSAISDDQLHEQNNKIIKGDGGAVGILDNETALLKWMVGGPEISRMLIEFENARLSPENSNSATPHHEDSTKFSSRYLNHVSKLVTTFRIEGNPFTVQEMQTVGNQKLIMTEQAEKSVKEAYVKGKEQYDNYVKKRLVEGSVSVHDVLPRNNLELFHSKKTRPNKLKVKVADLKKDSNIFCKLYVACQTRTGNVDDFFSHENSLFPPSISENGKQRKATSKSDILQCLQDYSLNLPFSLYTDVDVSAVVIDGAALVHMLMPGSSSTFHDYCTNVIGPHIRRILQTVQRVDVVFDRYIPASLKSETRDARGTGQVINVTPATTIPKRFQNFLSVDVNKEQLFHLLADFLVKYPIRENTAVICTYDDSIRSSSSDIDLSDLSPCTHEEADGRLLLHANNLLKSGHTKVTIRTVDSDVVIIAVSAFKEMSGMQELWIDFGVGKNKKFIPVHEIVKYIPDSVASNLPFFHAFTGCDTVSTFCGIGKKSAWKAWMNFREVDESFEKVVTESFTTETDFMKIIERFVVLMYDRTSSCEGVNECRRVLFTKKNRSIENIPPSADALVQHTKRASLQAKIWKNCLKADAEVYDPCSWGWKLIDNTRYSALWCTQPDVSGHCTELIKCSCKKVCKTCKCKRNNLSCTQLCGCEGHCSQTTAINTSQTELDQEISDDDIVYEDVEEEYDDIVYEDVEEEYDVDNEVIIFSDE